jgi:hypothetical protein
VAGTADDLLTAYNLIVLCFYICDVQAWKTDSLHLLLQKDLQPSDIGSLGRIILPKVRDTLLFVGFYFSYDGLILARDLLVLIGISLSLECKTNIMTSILPEFASRNVGETQDTVCMIVTLKFQSDYIYAYLIYPQW